MDPRQTRTKKLTKPQIWDLAEELRAEYIRDSDIPVNIEVVSQVIGIPVIPTPKLHSELGMDGFLSNDLKHIYIDEDLYNDEENRYEPRIRFTIAHELGHYWLHKEVIKELDFATIAEWIKFRLALPPSTTGWFEYQANEFAGRLLVPVNRLIELTGKARSEILKSQTWNSSPMSKEQLANMVAPMICGSFNVSSEVIVKRLQNDVAFLHLGI